MEVLGDLSAFEIFISVVALMTGGYTAYKSFFQGPRITLFTGESVTLVSNGDKPLMIWVSGVAVNMAAKVGVINPMRVHLKDPSDIEIVGKVTRFVDAKVDPPSLSPAYALSVPPHGSTPFHIEASIEYPEGLPNSWVSGKYHAQLQGWVVGNRSSTKHLTSGFAFEVPDVLEMVLEAREGRFTVLCSECVS